MGQADLSQAILADVRILQNVLVTLLRFGCMPLGEMANRGSRHRGGFFCTKLFFILSSVNISTGSYIDIATQEAQDHCDDMSESMLEVDSGFRLVCMYTVRFWWNGEARKLKYYNITASGCISQYFRFIN